MSALVEGSRESRDSLVFGDSTNHWHQFGLENSPFDDSLAVYYPVRQWEEHLRYLQQFRTGSYPLLLIPGIVGSGKTTLIKRFIESQNDPIRIHAIEAQPHHAVNQFIQALYSGSGMEAHYDANTSEVLHQLSLLSREVGPQLLLIDNAHRLPRETLMRLLHLLFSQDLSQTQFRVVLSGESQLQETVMNLLDAFASSRQVPSLQLEPLSMQEVREYLEFRFDQAGLSQKLPFTPALLKQIHLLSGGFPGRVNRVAQQVFVDTMRSDHHHQQPSSTNNLNQFLEGHKMKLMGVAVFFALVLLVWQYQPNHHNASTVLTENTEQSVPAQKSLPKLNITTGAAVTTSRTELSPDVREAIAAAVDHMQAEEMAETEQYEESFSMPVVHNQHLLAGAVMADNKAVQTAAVSVPTASEITKTGVSPTKTRSVIASADSVTGAELQLMSAKGFTIQIMGVRVPQLLEAFVAENHLTDVSYYRTKMNNQDWYVLVYGNFQSQEEARDALAKLPEDVRRQQPWVRSFDGVRQAIELAHEKEIPKNGARVAVR